MKPQSDCDSFFEQTRKDAASRPSETSTSTLDTDATAPPSASPQPPVVAIAGGLIGGLFLIAVIAFVIYRKRRRAATANRDDDPAVYQAPTAISSSLPATEKSFEALFPPTSLLAPEKSPDTLFGTAFLAPPEKSSEAIIPSLRVPRQTKDPPIDSEADSLQKPKDADADSLHKPQAPEAPQTQQPASSRAATTVDSPQRGGSSMVAARDAATSERAARARIAALTPAEMGRQAHADGRGTRSRFGLGRLLALTDADLFTMGIEDQCSREIVLRAVTYILARERDRVDMEDMEAATRMRGEELPQNSQS
ncbi:hypothetical protein HDU96_009638 [Phlyctochytrium bullatum]|nr:hypothetical protein HDU96_009638 [Phlyctochytrium bullatum]